MIRADGSQHTFPEDFFFFAGDQAFIRDVGKYKIVSENDTLKLDDGSSVFVRRDDLEKIACPVLAIGSKDDRILGCEPTLQIAERLGRRANFELHLYDGYGHATYDTAPDFKERVLRFLMSNNAS